MKTALLTLALMLPTFASAGALPHGHEVPAEVNMFEFVRLTKAVGKVKGEGCDAALKAAYADLDRVMGKNKTTDVIAVWPLNDRKGWSPVGEVMCDDNGKKQIVKMEAVVIKAGEGAAYKKISGNRILEILTAIQGESNMLVAARIAGMRTVDFTGKLYYVGMGGDREEYFTKDDSRNTRAVVVFREELLPQMQYTGQLLSSVPEFEGAEISASAKRFNKKGEEKNERFIFRIGTEEAQAFFRGELSEQEFINKGSVLFTDGGPPVKMDVSFVDAED